MNSSVLAFADAVTSSDLGSTFLNYLGPILSTGLVGVILTMILLRVKIMPTYVYDEAKAEWQRERSDLQADIARA